MAGISPAMTDEKAAVISNEPAITPELIAEHGLNH